MTLNYSCYSTVLCQLGKKSIWKKSLIFTVMHHSRWKMDGGLIFTGAELYQVIVYNRHSKSRAQLGNWSPSNWSCRSIACSPPPLAASSMHRAAPGAQGSSAGHPSTAHSSPKSSSAWVVRKKMSGEFSASDFRASKSRHKFQPFAGQVVPVGGAAR